VDRPTRIGAISDLHLSIRESGTWKGYESTETHLKRAVEELNDHSLDGVVFVGDLTKDGEPWNIDRVSTILADLNHPLAVIPGNHDLHATFDDHDGLTPSAFAERFGVGEFPFRQRCGDVDVLGLNSNAATDDRPAETYDGYLDTETLDWLRETITDDQIPLVVVHHNLSGTREKYESLRERLPDHGVLPDFENTKALLEVLHDVNAPLVLTGHLHAPLIARSGDVVELSLPALGSYPCAYSLIDINEQGTNVTIHTIASEGELVEMIGRGRERDRVLLSAAQLARLPIETDRTHNG
jgi:3',5'-cyclic AMP phosphodiesterase CpdA